MSLSCSISEILSAISQNLKRSRYRNATISSTPSRIDPFRFQAEVVFFVLILCSSIFCYGCMFALVVFDFLFSVLSQEIGCEERRRNDLFVLGGT